MSVFISFLENSDIFFNDGIIRWRFKIDIKKTPCELHKILDFAERVCQIYKSRDGVRSSGDYRRLRGENQTLAQYKGKMYVEEGMEMAME